ncbi:PHP domain-containing protein [Rhodohalobacter sp.]|uniref:PHP domain-containing protein n=1 Tax=Rhodohalobacter sp. TaxID=1974210 RepID=UPI002ACE5947|nr:PHP domain-containing protein [Rhodohalobacter sp.]MDZ7756670.1 PHP domain-containing protein [Rhodohalobacter sp.]
MGKADLHTHTIASDGAYSAEELLEKAAEKKLKIISITDHDTIKGYLSAKDKARELNIDLIPGVEVSAVWKSREVHILIYCFDENNEEFRKMLLNQKRARIRRMERIVEKLQKQGLDVSMDEVRAEAGPGNLGRPHAAAVLIHKRYVASVAEAFIRYLSTEKLGNIKTEYVTVKELVGIAKEAGGVLSLAHPGPLYTQDEIDELTALGLDGIECIHPSHNYSLQRTFSKLAARDNLLVTGGSDFHGKGKKDYDPYFGIVTLGDQHVMSLKRMARRRREIINTDQ